jgi:hypothetical protein
MLFRFVTTRGKLHLDTGTGVSPQRSENNGQKAILKPVGRIGMPDIDRKGIALAGNDPASSQPRVKSGAGHL